LRPISSIQRGFRTYSTSNREGGCPYRILLVQSKPFLKSKYARPSSDEACKSRNKQRQENQVCTNRINNKQNTVSFKVKRSKVKVVHVHSRSVAYVY